MDTDQTRTRTRCISAQLPDDLWEAVHALAKEMPGLSKSALIKAMFSIGLSADRRTLREHLGRY